mmetsp:Transcript_46280/g.128775  ORF Transcript_46280/g.128775 Transcript_46280/m.128775 type:complete len:744 (-) Transcript_46280:114-2345(-)|eukprot:CAMPEP_0117561754 /NCGR_PEP_ID=MMETSP0784-20121206/54588_1 /TAXON_ID=39447 /ORGANISM="" /LENGTH=743 /DNA_ID=CAMNT_0005359271 /DNA_START=143 /DNA_END=2374 /DNA_ORIENTATION=+
MRQVAAVGIGGRPASRARARSPAGPSTTRQSQAAAYGFQSPASRGASGSSGGAPVGLRGSVDYKTLPGGTGCTGGTGARPATRGGPGLGGGIGGATSSSEPGTSKASRNSRLAVVVRKRPMNNREAQAQQQDVLFCRHNTVMVREPKLKVDLTRYVEEHNFLFDQAFDETVTNEKLYCACVRPLIDAVFNRAKCTCFAYGQTGSGKTFTMMGPPRRQGEGIADAGRTPGIFLLASQDIFRCLNSKEHSYLGVYIAFYEIYCGKLFDLLNNRQILHARENAKSNVVIVGLQEHLVENVQELMEVIEFGLNCRTTGVTAANVDSSRSHAILQICLKDVRSKDESDGRLKEHGKVSFIDLAGSERGADTLDTDRQTRMDGAEINKSLLALKECIRALDQQSDHTPFRGSKLTQVLKDSFVGRNCRTVMIANVSPCSCAVEHSLNTLRYAYRVKELRRGNPNGPCASIGPSDFCGATLGSQGELAIEEEEEDYSDEGSCGEEPPPGVTQQLRVAHVSSAAGTLSSPRDARLYEQPQRAQEPEEAGPMRRYATGPASAAMPSSDGGGTQATFGATTWGSSNLEAGAMAWGSSSMEAGQHSVAYSSGDGEHHCGDASPPASPSDMIVGQEVAPEVALEPVSSQAALDELARQHDKLIGTILAEEEELITSHRQHIDTMVELIKEEMVHLNNVDRPGSDVDAYVAGLDRILRMKAQYIEDIRGRVDIFKDHLQQEDTLSRKFQSLASSSH